MPSSETSGHSILAPSAASRWSVCTASVGFIEEHRLELDFSSSTFADEGTDAHAIAAGALTGQKVTGLKYQTSEMNRIVNGYTKFVADLVDADCEVHVEKKVPLFYGHGKGTVDVRIVNRRRRAIHIVDLKYGQGVGVYAKNNKQLAIYAESAIREIPEVTDDWIVTLVIYQPRDRNDDNAVRLWALTRAELRAFVQDIEKAVLDIGSNVVEFAPEPTAVCKWCPAKPICPAFMNYGLSALPEESREITAAFPKLPEPKALTRAQRVRVIAGRRALEDWLEAIEDYEVAQLMDGAEPMGFKLVTGKSNRAWKDPQKAALAMGEYLDGGQIYVPLPTAPEVISVAEAEGLIGKKDFAGMARFITKPEGKPTLVEETDKRPALVFGPSRDFKDLDAKVGSDFI